MEVKPVTINDLNILEREMGIKGIGKCIGRVLEEDGIIKIIDLPQN